MKKEILEKVLNSRKNIIVEGDVAVGKTSNVLFPVVDDMISKKESLLILDAKEEYLNYYYTKLQENDYNIIILNLRDMAKSEGWNPLEYPYNLYKKGNADETQEYLEKLCKSLFYEENYEESFWTHSASDFFTGVTLGLFEDGKKEEINFNSINNMINASLKKSGITDSLTNYFRSKDVNSKPYLFASTTIFAPKDTRGGIISVASQKLRVYVSREKLSNLLNKTTFNYDDIINKPTAIFLITKDENTYLNDLISMFIEQLYMILLDMQNNRKFNFILDNFDILDYCSGINDILSSCISRNIKVFLGTRSSKELMSKYGKYITNLCDLISIYGKNIKLRVNNTEEIVEKNFDTIIINKNAIVYPKLNIEPIKLFNISEKNSVNLKYDNPFDVDELLKTVDEKLKKIEEEAKSMGINVDEKKSKNKIKGLTENNNSLNVDKLIDEIDEKIKRLEEKDNNK